jgi:SAM-dependent methyltransferase
MSVPPEARPYGSIYKEFDSPLMRQLRHEAYGHDIGQHSWVTAEELSADIPRLQLSRESHLLDLGCGPCGPLTFVIAQVGCRGTGADSSPEAIAAGQARAASLRLQDLLKLQVADLNDPMPYAPGTFNAVMSLDVILHLRDRGAVFQEVARVLAPSGRFLFTDAAVITGAISDEETAKRAIHGHTQFVPPGFNEHMLQQSGFRLLEQADRTASLLKNAAGRLATRLAHRQELEKLDGTANFERQLRYLETVEALSQRRALSRIMYLAESV